MPAPKLDQIPALLDALVTTPSITEAARRCFMHPSTVHNYLVRSRLGDAQLQSIEWYGVTAPFHLHFANTKILAAAAIEQAALDRALNGVEVDVFYQGRRQYETVEKEEFKGVADEDMVARGFDPSERYERKAVKQWLKPSDQLVIRMLEAWNKRYRPHQQVDVNYGGVLRLERDGEGTAKTIDQKSIFDDDAETKRRGGHLALGRPATDSAELDKWNAAGEFKTQPVTFVDAEGNRTERVAAPDPLLSQPDSESARGMKEAARPGVNKPGDVGPGKSIPTSHARQQSTAGDGRERTGYGNVAPGGYRAA